MVAILLLLLLSFLISVGVGWRDVVGGGVAVLQLYLAAAVVTLLYGVAKFS